VVEHDLAKVGVEGSSPFARSRFPYREPRFDEGPLTSGLFVWHDVDVIAQRAGRIEACCWTERSEVGKDPRSGPSGPWILFDAAMQREPASTNCLEPNRVAENFFSISIEPDPERRALLTGHDCANIFASDHHADENSSLKTFKINDRRSRPAA
jgi:hypothetical protein